MSMDYNDFFAYDPSTGSLSWKLRPREQFFREGNYKSHLACIGRPIGWIMKSANGRVAGITINTRKKGLKDCLAHRIIWQMHYGEIPPGVSIDHIDGDPTNNRLENLRLATHSQNMRNSRLHSVNKHGVKGVAWDKRTRSWATQIRTDNGTIFLGRHKSKGMAAVAYAKAAIRYHGSFAKIGTVPVSVRGVPASDIARMRSKGLL